MEKNNQKKQVIDKNKRVRKVNKSINEDTNKNRKEMVIVNQEIKKLRENLYSLYRKI